MHPEPFFHVAIKVEDLEASTSFYAEQLGGEVIGRGAAEDGEGATAADYAALAVADKRVYLFDAHRTKRRGSSKTSPRAPSTSASSSTTS